MPTFDDNSDVLCFYGASDDLIEVCGRLDAEFDGGSPRTTPTFFLGTVTFPEGTPTPEVGDMLEGKDMDQCPKPKWVAGLIIRLDYGSDTLVIPSWAPHPHTPPVWYLTLAPIDEDCEIFETSLDLNHKKYSPYFTVYIPELSAGEHLILEVYNANGYKCRYYLGAGQ